MTQTPRRILPTLLAALTLLPSLAGAQLAPSWERLKISDYVQQLTLGGDLRLRYDAIRRRGGAAAAANDRYRLRYRLRLFSEFKLPNDITAFARLGSGTGEQVSTNQTYGNMSNEKAIWIDQVWAKWNPQFDNGQAYLMGGKMQNMIWRTYSSDLVWDDDFNPEGFQEGGEYVVPSAGLTVFGSALQLVAQEATASGTQYEFTEQVGVEKTLPLDLRVRSAVAYHKWSDEQRASLDAAPAALQDGNRRAGNILLNKFGVAEWTTELKGWAGKLPVSGQVTLVRNMRARGDLPPTAAAGATAGQTVPTARDGYQLGAIIGAAKAKGTWEVAYFKKYAQTDATVADTADSDFGDGGTNRKGHIVWVAWAPTDWMLLKAKGFITEVIDPQYNPGDKAVNRLQLDWSVKF